MPLYGLPLVVGRRVQYGSIDPVVSRELFIRHALVAGRVDDAPPVLGRQPAGASSRSPRWRSGPAAATSAVDDETLFELYDARIPADVVSTRHFDRWWKTARRQTPDLLTFTPEMLTNAAAAGQVRVEDYPDEVHLTQGLTLPLSYAFAPGRGGRRRHRRRAARRAGRRRRGDVGGVAGLHRARACARSW